MVTKCDNQPTTTDRVNIEQSVFGRWSLGRQSFAISCHSQIIIGQITHHDCYVRSNAQRFLLPPNLAQNPLQLCQRTNPCGCPHCDLSCFLGGPDMVAHSFRSGCSLSEPPGMDRCTSSMCRVPQTDSDRRRPPI